MQTHISTTQKRLQDLPEKTTLLALQDKTQLDFTHHPATGGLGIIDQQVWKRSEEDFGKKYDRKNLPVCEKESQNMFARYSLSYVYLCSKPVQCSGIFCKNKLKNYLNTLSLHGSLYNETPKAFSNASPTRKSRPWRDTTYG